MCNSAKSTHLPWCRVCMWQNHNKKLCSFYGLWHYLDTELLNANLVHHVGTAKEVQRIVWRLQSSSFLWWWWWWWCWWYIQVIMTFLCIDFSWRGRQVEHTWRNYLNRRMVILNQKKFSLITQSRYPDGVSWTGQYHWFHKNFSVWGINWVNCNRIKQELSKNRNYQKIDQTKKSPPSWLRWWRVRCQWNVYIPGS